MNKTLFQNPKINSVLIICGIILIFIITIYVHNTPKKVLLSFDVEEINSPEEVNFIIEELNKVNATATFFIEGNFALKYPGLIKNISEKHEIASHTMTHPDLKKLNKTEIEWELIESKKVLKNITNKTIIGFRAPYNKLNNTAIIVINDNYKYDASFFKGYSWFGPLLLGELKEIPISTMFFIPMEDVIFTHYLKLGDQGYFLMANKQKEVISIGFHPQHIWKHKLAFIYLLKKYNDQKVSFISHKEYLENL